MTSPSLVEQVGLGKTSMKLLQALERDRRNDVMFEVVFHPGAHEVILEPSSDTGSGRPVPRCQPLAYLGRSAP